MALFVILMTVTGNLVSAAGFDWSDDTFGNACKKVYSVSFRSGRGVSSAVYEKLGKKQDIHERVRPRWMKNDFVIALCGYVPVI